MLDIRTTIAYQKFIKAIGGAPTDMDVNGYDILAKEYKREIKYTFGNLMQLQMRDFIDRSLQSLLDFFESIPNLSELTDLLNGVPLRSFNIEVTQAFHREYTPSKAAKGTSNNLSKDDTTSHHTLPQKQESFPTLKLPAFCNMQDYTRPIFKLDLVWVKQQQHPEKSIKMKRCLHFSQNLEDILKSFDKLVDNVLNSFNRDFMRPEFCKIMVVTQKRYEG